MIVQAPFADRLAIASVTLATGKAKALLNESKLTLPLSPTLSSVTAEWQATCLRATLLLVACSSSVVRTLSISLVRATRSQRRQCRV